MIKADGLHTIEPLPRAEYEALLAVLVATAHEARDAINKAKMPRKETVEQQNRRRMGPDTGSGVKSERQMAVLASLFFKVVTATC